MSNQTLPPPTSFKFDSQRFPGATMNRYGVIHWQGHEVSPSIRGMVLREAIAAGCKQVPAESLDTGLIWTMPEAS
ncbi:MAG TPA: hypothetical protein VNX46_07600 [Candidatus Acidoferrum sp.]|jgi:hypothetical protein|nr:hypothetical protein [Candidatus Acidoferrum sp.]